MDYQTQIDQLKTARDLIRKAARDLPVPMLESALAEADMNLHWALWNLGEQVELVPEKVAE
jgi:hypothetical protein